MEVLFKSLISEDFIKFLAPLLLFVVGIIIETKYVGRIAMFSNAASLYLFYHSINMPLVLGIIVNVVITIGLVGGLSRFFKIPLFSAFYSIGWIASSVVTAILLIYGLSI